MLVAQQAFLSLSNQKKQKNIGSIGNMSVLLIFLFVGKAVFIKHNKFSIPNPKPLPHGKGLYCWGCRP